MNTDALRLESAKPDLTVRGHARSPDVGAAVEADPIDLVEGGQHPAHLDRAWHVRPCGTHFVPHIRDGLWKLLLADQEPATAGLCHRRKLLGVVGVPAANLREEQAEVESAHLEERQR